MKHIFYLIAITIFLSSCQKEMVNDLPITQPIDNVGTKKLSLIVVKWNETPNNPPTQHSIYYKITYDTTAKKIFIDSDSTNANHEYVYEYNNLGQLIKSSYLDANNNNQPMTFTYTRNANSFVIISNSQGTIENRVYNKTVIPGGYRYIQNIPNPSGSSYAQFDFTNDHLPISDIHFDGDAINPNNYDKREYIFENSEYQLEKDYSSLLDPGILSDTIVRGNGSTKLLYNFIKELKGTDLLYFWGYDTDNFLGLYPERLGISLFNYVNFSNKEVVGSIPVNNEVVIQNSFYDFGEIKSTKESFEMYEEDRTYSYK